MASTVIYVGKEIIKVDLDNLLDTNISSLDKITYEIAKKYGDFIAAIEITVEDCLGSEVNIVDEVSYKLAVADLVNIINEDKEEPTTETTNNNTILEEELEMKETFTGNMKAAVEEVFSKFEEAKENIKVNAGETKEEYIEKVDDSLNVMKGALGDVLNTLDNVFGFSVLKHSILDIIQEGCVGSSSKKDLFAMASRCRELIEEEIELLEMWGTEKSFKDAVTLKALIGDERGKSIFEAFVSGVVWIGKKVNRKLRDWFHVDDEKSVMASICRSIAGFVDVLRAGIKIVWNATKFAISFVIAGAIKIADIVYRAIKGLVSKIKNWTVAQYEKLTSKDVEDDSEFEEENFIIVSEEI